MTILLRIISLLVIPFVLPVIIALIYNFFYGRHLNRQLETGIPTGRWISPLAVGAGIFGVEVVAIIAAFSLYMASPSHSSTTVYDNSQSECDTYTEEEIGGTPYEIFDGKEVKDYTMKDITEGSFHYYLYTKKDTAGQTLPAYLVTIEYTGKEKVRSASGFLLTGSAGSGKTMPASDWYYAVIDTGNICIYSVDKAGNEKELSEENYAKELSDISYTLSLFSDKYTEGVYLDPEENDVVDSLKLEFTR